MNDADRRLLAEIAERDREWMSPSVTNAVGAGYQAAYDRRELLRIVRELNTLAGHRTDGEHDCLLMNCARLGPEVERLLRERDTLAEDLADVRASAEATKGRWGR